MSEPGLLHSTNGYIAWHSYGTPNSGSVCAVVSHFFVSPQDPFPFTRLPPVLI